MGIGKGKIIEIAVQIICDNNKMKSKIRKDTSNILNIKMSEHVNEINDKARQILGLIEGECLEFELDGEDKRCKNLQYDGRTKSMTEWAKELNISYDAIAKRLKQGWSVKKALETPIRKKRSVVNETINNN
jgi:hypothetical protein